MIYITDHECFFVFQEKVIVETAIKINIIL